MDPVIHDVVGGNVAWLDALLDLYGTHMPEYTGLLPGVRERAYLAPDHDPRFVEHHWLVEVDGQPAAMTHFKYVPQRNVGLGLALVVQSPYRKVSVGGYRRLAEYVNRRSVEQLIVDAQARGRPTPLGLAAEVENPPESTDPELHQAAARLVARYREYGFVPLDVDYYEPPSARGLQLTEPMDALGPSEAFHPHVVGLFPAPDVEFDPSNPEAVNDIVLAFLVDHYRLPPTHWSVRRALKSVLEDRS